MVDGATAAPRLAEFTECIVNSLHLDPRAGAGMVLCALREDKLCLQRAPVGPGPGAPVLLTHPPFCPIKQLSAEQAASLPPDITSRGVNVGVVVILETCDGRVLLTRRARHMRTFPGIWVPPGGHIELGETLTEAGLRELREETGLGVGGLVTGARQLCLWESVYPYMLSMGPPQRHHLVVYTHVTVSASAASLQRDMVLDSEEVDAAMWLDSVLARLVAEDKVPDACPDHIQAVVVDSEGNQSLKLVPSSIMTNTAPAEGKDIERVSTGTRYALAQWLAART